MPNCPACGEVLEDEPDADQEARDARRACFPVGSATICGNCGAGLIVDALGADAVHVATMEDVAALSPKELLALAQSQALFFSGRL